MDDDAAIVAAGSQRCPFFLDAPGIPSHHHAMSTIATVFQSCAVIIAIHGVALGIFAASQASFWSQPIIGEDLQAIVFRVLTIPALVLAYPFASMLWRLRLMNAPGWLAWPKPLGLVLVYSTWVVGLFLLAAIARKLGRGRRRPA